MRERLAARRRAATPAPDPLVDEPRAEVPAVVHAAACARGRGSCCRPAARSPAPRARRPRADARPSASHVDVERRERALVMRASSRRRRSTVASWSTPSKRSVAAAARAAGRSSARSAHPLGERGSALVVGRRRLAGAHEVVDDAARHARRQPARRVPRLVGPTCQLPLVAEAAAQLPVVAVEAGHSSSRSVSATGVAVARHAERLDLVRRRSRPRSSRPRSVDRRARRAARASRTRARRTPSPSSAPSRTVDDDVAAAVARVRRALRQRPRRGSVSSSANGGWFSSAARRDDARRRASRPRAGRAARGSSAGPGPCTRSRRPSSSSRGSCQAQTGLRTALMPMSPPRTS